MTENFARKGALVRRIVPARAGGSNRGLLQYGWTFVEIKETEPFMQITLYQRFFPVKDSPTAYSFIPFPTSQKHTFAVGQTVYEAAYREIKITVPDDAKVDALKNLLTWPGEKGAVRSTATEVLNFAQAKAPGFRIG